ncbi:MAG: dipeptide epimerase [Alphaproteobacteria bacterium]|nr:dipeptide epimerase [Alphaproteobacteria bacterium]
MSGYSIIARVERWPIAGSFTISRGSKTEAVVVVVEVGDGTFVGRGESVPYARYGESAEKTIAEIGAWEDISPETLHRDFGPGATRNALDCAFWDLRARRTGAPVYKLAGLSKPKPLIASYTISLDTPEKMARAAAEVAHRPLLKIKLGKEGDPQRIEAVRNAAPRTRLIADANEGWTDGNILENMEACRKFCVELVEQPLPADKDSILKSIEHAVPVCADESVFDSASLAGLAGKYDAVNVKLDKTGGLTEALATISLARGMGLKIMVGCMVSTSLAVAPAILAAQGADFVDLDAPLLLAADRKDGLRYEGGLVYPPSGALWGRRTSWLARASAAIRSCAERTAL